MADLICDERLVALAREFVGQAIEAIDTDGKVRTDDERCREIVEFTRRVAWYAEGHSTAEERNTEPGDSRTECDTEERLTVDLARSSIAGRTAKSDLLSKL